MMCERTIEPAVDRRRTDIVAVLGTAGTDIATVREISGALIAEENP